MRQTGPSQINDTSLLPPGRRTIVYVTMSLDTGGTEKHLSLVVPRLRDHGWTPIVYCLWRRGAFAAVLEQAGIEVIGRDAPDRAARDWKRDGLHLARAWLRLARLVARRKPQIMHFFLPLAYMLGAPLAILLRVPVKVMSRRSLNIYQGGQSAVHRVECWLHARMNAVVANSRRVARDLIDSEGCPPDKVGLIYNGTDLSAVSAVAPADGPGESKAAPSLTLIIVANLIPYKGHADLLTALGGIASQLPQGWRLLCAGRDEGCGQQLIEQAGQLGIGANVHFLGERSDVPRLLRTADIGILCSHQEGFSNAVIEGLAAGLPMVVTDVGGNAEAVADGETGLVVPPRDPAALGRAILALAAEPDRRRSMGRAAREDAVRRFSIESCVDRYDRLYRGLMDHKLPGEIEGLRVTLSRAEA
ncbi:MAG: glycosyltransferase [Pseudorhodoplanes sp.]|nr:glycosyltransferase [Pseudorhodoplanes sp.]